jgi:hypothetical protein
MRRPLAVLPVRGGLLQVRDELRLEPQLALRVGVPRGHRVALLRAPGGIARGLRELEALFPAVAFARFSSRQLLRRMCASDRPLQRPSKASEALVSLSRTG